jgi:cytochrome c
MTFATVLSNSFRRSLGIFFAAAFTVSAAAASEHGTRDEATAMVNAAVAHVKKVGPEQAFKDFTTDKGNWVKKDLYVFAFDTKANWLAHGTNEKLVGRNLMELKDQNGKPFIREFLQVVSSPKGEGWVDYDWSNPTTKKVEPKTTFVKRVPGTDYSVAVGIYR